MVTSARSVRTESTVENDAERIEGFLRRYRSGLKVGQLVAHTGLTEFRIKFVLKAQSTRFARRGSAFVLAPPPAVAVNG